MTKFTKLALLFAASLSLAVSAHASDWTGAGGNWDSDANPGWNGTGVPNAIGAIANFGDIVTGTTVQNVLGGVIVGTVSFTSTANIARTITNTNGITMNQDGAGAGFATISNSDAAVGTTNAMIITGGTLTLADDLHISNTGGSTNTTGSIQISAAIQGAGNLTFSNVVNNVAQAGSLRLVTGVNTFTGSSLIQQGTVSYNLATAFGASANVITLGQSGFGGATLISTAAVGSNNSIVVASGTTGPLVLGSISAAAGGGTYSGSITLNGNVSLTSANTTATNGLKFTGAITGPGSVTIISPSTGSVVFSGAGVNTYSGGTIINSGTLAILKDGGLGTGNVSLTASGVNLTLQGGVTNNYIADTASISIVSGATANLNYLLGTTDVVGGIVLGGVPQLAFGTYGSPASGADFQSAFFLGNGTLTLIPEPATYMLLGFGVLVCAQRFRRKKN